ncbi:MAG: hypothetical protein ACE3JU_26410 [Paenibacillus sp.]
MTLKRIPHLNGIVDALDIRFRSGATGMENKTPSLVIAALIVAVLGTGVVVRLKFVASNNATRIDVGQKKE